MISMRLDGGDRLAKTLRELPNRINRSIQRQALVAAAEVLRTKVVANAPHAPGSPDLRNAIGIAKDVRPGRGDVGAGVGVPRGFFYDWFNEFGTVKQQAKPFWRPAFDSEKSRMIKVIAAEMWAALIKRGAGSGRGSGGGVGL